MPGERCFIPKYKFADKKAEIFLSLDEFEAIRLSCFEGLKQEEAARLMRVSRPTFSRIVNSGHKKIADALVNIKTLRIEGGCCKVKGK